MKNIKLKALVPACCLLLASVLGGCGTAQSQDKAQTVETANDSILSAYSEIVKAAPAIEGEPAELSDASFGREQNTEKFGNHCELFAVHDINSDGIPELITLSTVNFKWSDISVYTYADGKAVLLKTQDNAQAPCTFEQISTANGTYTTFICGENHIHSLWRGTDPAGETAEENNAYVIEGTVLTRVDCSAVEGENAAVNLFDIAKANNAENAAAIVH